MYSLVNIKTVEQNHKPIILSLFTIFSYIHIMTYKSEKNGTKLQYNNAKLWLVVFIL